MFRHCSFWYGGRLGSECRQYQAYGNEWIGVAAIVRDNATVMNNGRVTGSCRICGNAIICDNASIEGAVVVKGCTTIGGKAMIKGAFTVPEGQILEEML